MTVSRPMRAVMCYPLFALGLYDGEYKSTEKAQV